MVTREEKEAAGKGKEEIYARWVEETRERRPGEKKPIKKGPAIKNAELEMSQMASDI